MVQPDDMKSSGPKALTSREITARKGGAPHTHIVAGMPFLSYHQSDAQALENAGKLLQSGGASSVKLEGGVAIAPRIGALVAAGIPVMAHVGLGPQSVGTIGGFRIQGRDLDSARKLIADAEAVAAAGAYAVVIELAPAEVAALVTERIPVPTIGIGAGASCDGQVLVAADVIGLDDRHRIKFVRRYADVGQTMARAFGEFAADVRSGSYPSADESHHLDPDVVSRPREAIERT